MKTDSMFRSVKRHCHKRVNSEDQAEDVGVILVVEHNQPAGRESLAWYREVICCHQHQLTSSCHLWLTVLASGRKTTNLFNVIQVGNKIFTSIIPKLVSIFKNYEIFISKHKLLQSPISYHFHCLNLSLDTISLSAGRQCLPWISSPSCICYHHHLNCSPSFSKSL